MRLTLPLMAPTLEGLEPALDALARSGNTTTYGALAAQLGLDGAGRIQRLTGALEDLMDQDAALGRPFRAAVVCGRASGGLPARGFFDKARALGVYRDGMDPADFIKAQRAALLSDW